jgi:hypothetical protein
MSGACSGAINRSAGAGGSVMAAETGCECVAPWGRSPEFMGTAAPDGELPCDTLVGVVLGIYTVASLFFVLAFAFQLSITRNLGELARATPVLVAEALCLSVTVPRSWLVRSEEDYFYVDLGFTLRWQLAAVFLYAMLGAFLSKYVAYLRKQIESVGIRMGAGQIAMIRAAPRIFVAQIVATILLSAPLSAAATQQDPAARAVLLRVGMALDGLVKTLNAVAVVPVLRLTVEQLRGFRDLTGALNNNNEGSANETRRRIDGLISSISSTLACNVVYVCVNVPPLFLGALAPAAMPALRYLYPLSYAITGSTILFSTVLLYRKGARRHRHQREPRHGSRVSPMNSQVSTKRLSVASVSSVVS